MLIPISTGGQGGANSNDTNNALRNAKGEIAALRTEIDRNALIMQALGNC